MAKAASPIRLNATLMAEATSVARLQHRSTAEQVEYWADLGRRLSDVLGSDTLLAVSAGLASVRVEPVASQPIDPEPVFSSLARQRKSGALSKKIAAGKLRYQASAKHPGLLERIDAQGHIAIGQFTNGVFKPKPVAR